jgi:tetratricopeptide (TPR) repeat protein
MAEDLIEGLIPVTREEVRLLLEAGYVFIEMRKFDDARAVFEGVAALLPKAEAPRMALGNCWFAQGEFRKALAEHRAAQKLAPNNATAHAHAAEVLFFLGKTKEALAECNKAVKLDNAGPGGVLAKALLKAHESGALPPKDR